MADSQWPPAPDAQAHHQMPWKFRREFWAAGLDPSDPKYGEWANPVLHAARSYRYNRRWDEFFRRGSADKESILGFLEQLLRDPDLKMGYW
jgi:hypothetical protein